MSQIEKHEPVYGDANYKWYIKVYEHHSLLCVDWSTDAPFTPQDANVAVYKEPLSKPYPRVSDDCHWIRNELSGTWISKMPWGSGYYVTINATVGTADALQWRYVVTAGPTVG